MSNSNAELGRLAEQIKAGNKQAYGQLIELTQNRLLRFTLALTGDRALAEDLCQETYVKAYSAIKTLQKNEAVIDWLFKIVKNLHIDFVRARKNQNVSLEEADLESVCSDEGDRAELIAVHRALSQFDPEDRHLLLLVDLEERTYDEAGQILGISEDAVRTRLFRLRKRFAEIFKKPETK